jgi:hypothetical protein
MNDLSARSFFIPGELFRLFFFIISAIPPVYAMSFDMFDVLLLNYSVPATRYCYYCDSFFSRARPSVIPPAHTHQTMNEEWKGSVHISQMACAYINVTAHGEREELGC